MRRRAGGKEAVAIGLETFDETNDADHENGKTCHYPIEQRSAASGQPPRQLYLYLNHMPMIMMIRNARPFMSSPLRDALASPSIRG